MAEVTGRSASEYMNDANAVCCSGTERVSATAIIAAAVEELDDCRCRFDLATHQHDVADMVDGMPGISIRHLSVSTDADGDLVCERTDSFVRAPA
eukprot:jgi/Tetstr1/459055/TSEL_004520.t2